MSLAQEGTMNQPLSKDPFKKETLPNIAFPSLKEPAPIKGAFYFLFGVFSYAIANVFIKFSSSYYPLGEMVVLRGLVFLIPLFFYMVFSKNLRLLFRTRHLKLHILQGALSAFCLYFLFYAFDVMPLSDATTLSFTETFIVSLFSAFFLKECLSFKHWVAIFLGFLGVLLIMQPCFSEFSFHFKGSLSCILAVTFDAIVLLSLRNVTQKDHVLTILFYYALFSTVGGFIFFPFENWAPFVNEHMASILGLGVFGALGQIFITLALRDANAGYLSPLMYTQLLWALLFDGYFWGEYPNLLMILGSTFIILGGFYILWQKRTHLAL